jgi:hypothetical protein
MIMIEGENDAHTYQFDGHVNTMKQERYRRQVLSCLVASRYEAVAINGEKHGSQKPYDIRYANVALHSSRRPWSLCLETDRAESGE